ncbi:hypothetical protein KGD83_21805 [Nocardiopsis akebiae]|uniref:Uncharacterized protein n=1 Tax=Nocardiopsis akebiae TaxID=2831968 RepID=A0ABX8C0F4_9ACTN|nr:hypothetical protein [Nocardiopsis akebiae]QUX27890.1 hypothetical protein KGD83_21805 [Nocardiopsis akebiae]
MTTIHSIQTVGFLAVLLTLFLVLAVALLRLVALPLAGIVLVLDGAADLAARPLSLTAPAPKEGTR